jgi:fructose-1-phosphate kinase PfkB-like protein
MVSGMVYGRVQGLDLESLARFATAMGTHAVTRVGSGVDSMQVLKKIESDVSLEDWSDQAVRHGGH